MKRNAEIGLFTKPSIIIIPKMGVPCPWNAILGSISFFDNEQGIAKLPFTLG